MRRISWIAHRFLAVSAALPVLAALAAPDSAAQDGDGAITVTVYGCPAGVTAETASPDTCHTITAGFGLTLAATDAGVAAQTLSTADYDGSAYTWSGLPVPSTYLVIPARVPGSPYTSHHVDGAGITSDALGNAHLRLTESGTVPSIAVYHLSPATSQGFVPSVPDVPRPTAA